MSTGRIILWVYPPGEGLAAATTTGPNIFRPALAALAPFQWADGFDRRQTGALNLSAAQSLADVLGASRGLVTAEIGLRQVYDLPNPNVSRYLRPDGFGSGPINGVCAPETPGVKFTCSYSGFVTANAQSYRLRGSLTYDVPRIPDLDVTLSASFGQDVSGWSWDGSLTQGRYLGSIGLRANYKKSYYAEIVYAPTWGGDFNLFRDRSVIMASMGAKFQSVSRKARLVPQTEADVRKRWFMARFVPSPA